VLDDDGDVGLAAAVDFAAGGREAHAVGHLFVLEVIEEGVHHRLDHAGSVGAGDVAVQPALGVGNHRNGVAGTADGEAVLLQFGDQRSDLRFGGDDVLDVGTDGEADAAFGKLVGDIAEFANREDVHLTGCAGTHGPDFIARVRDVVQHAGTRTVVVFPVAVVGGKLRVEEFLVVEEVLDRLAHLRLSHESSPSNLVVNCCYTNRVFSLAEHRFLWEPVPIKREAWLKPPPFWR
jgi:hypothetical protein